MPSPAGAGREVGANWLGPAARAMLAGGAAGAVPARLSGSAWPNPKAIATSASRVPARCLGERTGHPQNLRYTAARPRWVRIGTAPPDQPVVRGLSPSVPSKPTSRPADGRYTTHTGRPATSSISACRGVPRGSLTAEGTYTGSSPDRARPTAEIGRAHV